MSGGTTVFERWRERRRLAGLDTEERFLNPLDIRLGDIVSLNLLDWRGLDFQATQFRVVTRHIGEREFPFVDYYLRHRGLDQEEIHCLLRYIPLDDPDPSAGRTHTILLLKPQDAFEHDTAVMNTLEANSGYTFFVEGPPEEGKTDPAWLPETFPSRVEDIRLPYDCSVDIVKDKDHNGEVELDEVESHKLTLWDFWRLVSVEGGRDRTEYLYVEVDQKDGWTELFVGEEVDPDVVVKLDQH